MGASGTRTNNRNCIKDIMKNFLSGIVILAFALMIPRIITYGISAVQTKQQVTQLEQRSSDPNSEPMVDLQKGKAEFMASCDTGSLDGARFDQTEYCGCTFDAAVQEKGINWIINAGLNYTESEIEAAMRPYAEKCIGDQGITI